MKLRYVVVTGNEGGMDYESYESISDIVRGYAPDDTTIKAIVMADLGSEIQMRSVTGDLNSTCFVLKPENT